MVSSRHDDNSVSWSEAQAMGALRLRVSGDRADRVRHRLPARVFLLPVVSEFRPVGRPRARVRRREELHRGDLPRPAVPGLGLEHGGHHRAVAGPRAPAGPRHRDASEPGAPRPAHHHRAPRHPGHGLAGHGGDGLAHDVRREVRRHQQPRPPARSPRRLLRLVLVALHGHRGGRAGRGLAQHAVHDAGAAGRDSVDSHGALRGGPRRRRGRLAALLVDHAAAPEVHDGRGRDDTAHRSHQAVRFDLRAHVRRTGRRHRDGRVHDLSDGLQGLPDELRGGHVVRHRRGRADPDAPVLLDAARPRSAGSGLMAIALERSAVVTQRARRHRLWRVVGHFFVYLGLAAALVFFLGPFFWIVTTSLKGNEDFFAFPPVWIPAEPSLKHYAALFTRSSGARYFMNSLVISTMSMIAPLAVSLPTAYSIARWRFGGGLLSIFLLVLRMLPAIALIIPIYIVYKMLGITNNYLALVVIYTVLYIPFSVWLLVGFLRDFPVEIEEAAMIDGCSRLRALVQVVVPIIAPGMAVVALFSFIATWNEFLFAIVLTGIETKTMMVLVTSFTSGGTDMFYGEASASVVLGVLPAFAVAFILQRYLVKGLALGGTKG